MVQNHLLQLLCLVAMEPPHKLNAENIRAEKLKVLKSLSPITAENVATMTQRGQYVSGAINGQRVPGYLDELDEDCLDSTNPRTPMKRSSALSPISVRFVLA